MKLLWYLLLIFVLYYMYITLRFIFKRILLLRKIKQFAKVNNIEYKITMPAFLFPSNRYGTALLLKTERATYNIRLFGLLRNNCGVHFWGKSSYSVEKYIPRMLVYGERHPGRRRNLGKWNISSDTDISILLYSSANSPIYITQTLVNHISPLRAGDRIEDVILADTDFLFRYIEKCENH